MLGGWLVTLNLAGLGWRSIFCVNVPIGVGIALAAAWLMPAMPRSVGTRLDLRGAVVLFVGLLGLIVPLMFGRELGWPWWIWLAMAAGVAVLVGFVRLQRAHGATWRHAADRPRTARGSRLRRRHVRDVLLLRSATCRSISC